MPPAALVGLRLAAAIALFWNARGHLAEGRERLTRLLELPAASKPTPERAAALLELGGLEYSQSDYDQAQSHLEASRELYRTLGHDEGHGRALNYLANTAFHRGEFARAAALYDEGLAECRRLGDRRAIAQALTNLANVANSLADYATARERLEESLAHQARARDPARYRQRRSWGSGTSPRTRAISRRRAPTTRNAWRSRRRAAIASAPHGCGSISAMSRRRPGIFCGAHRHYVDSLRTAIELGDRLNQAGCLSGLAFLAARCSVPEAAAHFVGAGEALRESMGVAVSEREHEEEESLLEELRRAMGDNGLARALAAGRGLAIAGALAAAERLVPPSAPMPR